MRARALRFCSAMLIQFTFTCGCSAPVSSPVVKTVRVTLAQASVSAGGTTTATAVATLSDSTTKDVTLLATWASSADSVAFAGCEQNPCSVYVVAPGSATLTATYDGISGSSTLTSTTATMESLTVAAASNSLPTGSTTVVTAEGSSSDGSVHDLTSTAMWMSSSTDVASVSSNGVVSALKAGTTTISATVNGMSASVSLTVVAAVPVSMVVSPANVALPQGTSIQLAALVTASDQTSADQASTADWKSSDATVAAVSTGGLVLAEGVGTATITAMIGRLSASQTVIVDGPALSSLALSPSPVTIPLGLTQSLSLLALLTNGQTQNMDLGTAVLASSDTTVATVSGSGLITTVRQGTAVITARVGTLVASAFVAVSAPVLTDISISPPGPTVTSGQSLQLLANGVLSDGTMPDETAEVAWHSSDSTTAAFSTPGSPGLISCIMSGPVDVTASIADPLSTTGGQLTALTTVSCE